MYPKDEVGTFMKQLVWKVGVQLISVNEHANGQVQLTPTENT